MNFGTRKELLYASSQFNVLFNHFLSALHRAKTCVIAGYRFRDDRINKIVEEAVVTRKGDLRLVIVSPSVFWLEQDNSVLWKFVQLGWAISLGKPFGDALRDDSLLAAVEASNKAKTTSTKIIQQTPILKQEDTDQQKPVDPERILKTWRILGTTFDLTYFWMRSLVQELKELECCVNQSEAIKVGHLLMPLLRKVRDLCYHIRWVYEEMHFGSTYGGEYLETIKVRPKLTNDFSHMDLVRKRLPELGRDVRLVFNTYNNATEEYRCAVTDPNYGRDIEAPNYLSVAELVIRKTKSRIYELACFINKIYKGAGYEEPFEMIARHQTKLTAEAEEVLLKRKEHKNAKKGSSKAQEKRKKKLSTKKK